MDKKLKQFIFTYTKDKPNVIDLNLIYDMDYNYVFSNIN